MTEFALPYILFDDNFKIISSYGNIDTALLSQDIYDNILHEFSLDYFEKPITISGIAAGLINTSFLFVKKDNNLICYPTKHISTKSSKIWQKINRSMREPVSSIFAILPLILDDINRKDEENCYDNLTQVNKTTYGLLRTVTNLSLCEKIFEKGPDSDDIINLSSLITSIAESVDMIERNIHFICDIQDNIFIKGNKNLTVNGFFNMISNSINYSVEDNTTISIKLKKEKSKIVLTYSDNSIGIKDNIISHIFEPYFSKDPYDDTDEDPSLGLGLFILKSAIEAARGSVFLSSKFGEGVKYTISFPIQSECITNVFESDAKDFLLNRYSELFIQLYDSCTLPSI